jgi:hypothetical protein
LIDRKCKAFLKIVSHNLAPEKLPLFRVKKSFLPQTPKKYRLMPEAFAH